MIKNESIQKVMDTARVEEVLGDYINMKRSGSNYKANCPFHDERSASFMISPAKGIYKCFGCGKSGNSVRFLMDHEKMDFVTAIRHLAQRYQITLEETEQTREEKEAQTQKESLMIVMEYACNFFQQNLTQHDEGKAIGLQYFYERGISDSTIAEFRLGYCLDSWDHFSKSAINARYNPQFLTQLGLSKTKENGELFDFFKGRIIFPVMNLVGKPIAFGARSLKKDDKIAKYLNSPESDIYVKSKVLYGINLAKGAIIKEDYCIMVEGYMDVIQLHQAGIKNVVASSGTSLTEDQVRLVKRFTQNIYILYDGDKAGIKAALRGMEIVLEQGLNVKIALLPDGHDPDSYTKAYGGEAFKQYIEQQAKDIVTFQAMLFNQEAAQDPVKKADLVRDIIKTIAIVKDAIKRSFYIKECAHLMDVKEELIARETQRYINQKLINKKKEAAHEPIEATQSDYEVETSVEEWQPLNLANAKRKRLEIELCRLMIEYGDRVFIESENPFDLSNNSNVLQQIFEVDLSTDLVFDTPICQKVFDVILDNYRKGVIQSYKYYANHLDPEIADFVITQCHKEEDEIIYRWGKSNEPIEVPKYGDHYKKEIQEVIEQIYLSNLERVSQDFLNSIKKELTSNQYDEKAEKYLNYQKVFLEQYQVIAKKFQNVFRVY